MTEHNKYNNSKIYKIVSASSDKIYIGSTCNTLPKRLHSHLSNYKQYTIDNTNKYMSSYEIIKLGDYSIQLIEQCNFNNKQQLHEKEGQYVKLHRDICVNKYIPFRTYSEYYNDNKDKLKQYRIDNKEVIAKKKKEYNINNPERVAEQKKVDYDKHKEHILEYHKEYYITNKDIIAEKSKQTIQCECGLILTKVHLKNHQQTLKHFTNINKSYLNELTTL